MKRIVTLIMGMCLALCAFAQAQITTRREKISDFPSKITKVVLTGNDFHDIAIKAAVKSVWTISPFEFCSLDEFNALKKDANYYFLLLVKVQRKKESAPGISYFTLVKGTPDAETIDDMMELSNIPVCPADFPNGKEGSFMPALLDIMQKCVEKSMTSAFSGIGSIMQNITKTAGMNLIFDEADLAPQINEKYKTAKFGAKVLAGDDDLTMEAMDGAASNTAVGYVIAPMDNESASSYFLMLINAETHELYYYKKCPLKAGAQACFSVKDMDKILSVR